MSATEIMDLSGPAPQEARASVRKRAGQRQVGWWLIGMCLILLTMILVGGATRLTDSGLSITEWRPVTGVLPPLSAEQWEAEMNKYRQIPEYQLVNKGMSLADFKVIYYWEWGHRLLGRLIGLFFAVGFVWFWLRGVLDRPLAVKLGAAFVLGGLQGVLGWYMVMSGLTERVDVSQYRLVAHLGLAFVILAWMFWLALELLVSRTPGFEQADGKGRHRLFGWAVALSGLIYVQVLMGGFVAGLRAGYDYTDWPLMGGQWIPDGMWTFAPAIINIFEVPVTAQFTHRLLAYAVVIAVGLFAWKASRLSLPPLARRAVLVLTVTVAAQVLLGIWTLVSAVPLSLGLAHQVGAALVLAAGVFVVYALTPARRAV